MLCFSARKGAPSVHGDIMRRTFAAHGVKIKSLREIEGVEAFRATLESGLGVSVMAESGSLSQSEFLVLRHLEDTGPDLQLELHAVWRGDQESQLVANFVAIMKEVAPTRLRQKRLTAKGNRARSVERS